MSDFGKIISGYVAVAGGVNLDIGGKTKDRLVMEDSNPGFIHMSFGGVGRNIAHNLRLLDIDIKMFTALGDDYNAQLIRSSCDELGIDITNSLFVKDAASSTYMFINSEDGDMVLAINDMRICEHLTPTYYAGKLDLINNARALVLDANIPAESIEYLAKNVTVPIFADMVSTKKAMNVLPVIGMMQAIKANKVEAEVLSGIDIVDKDSLERAGRTLVDMGVKYVFISLGSEGMYVATKDTGVTVPSFKTKVVNTTGGGDCAMAALVRAYLSGLSPEKAAVYANAAASIAIGSVETISPDVSIENVEKIVGRN